MSLQELEYQSYMWHAGTVAVDTYLSTHVPVSIKTTVCLIQEHTSEKSHCLLAFIIPPTIRIHAWEQVCKLF